MSWGPGVGSGEDTEDSGVWGNIQDEVSQPRWVGLHARQETWAWLREREAGTGDCGEVGVAGPQAGGGLTVKEAGSCVQCGRESQVKGKSGKHKGEES